MFLSFSSVWPLQNDDHQIGLFCCPSSPGARPSRILGPPLQRQLHFDQSGSLAAAWRSFWAQAIFSCPAGPATIEIDECITFWDTQLPSRILTSRSTLRYPYHKSDPSENRFGAVWLKVCATLRRETHFRLNGALAAAWCPV